MGAIVMFSLLIAIAVGSLIYFTVQDHRKAAAKRAKKLKHLKV